MAGGTATYVDELKLIARSVGFDGMKTAVLGVASAITGAGVVASVTWDEATKTIVDGTGATDDALDDLLTSYQAVGRFGPAAATAIADLNTHTGRTGPLLEQLAEKALQAGVDTAILGGSIRRFNLVGSDQEALIDKLVVAGQAYGANVNSLQTDIGKYGGELEKLGLSMDEQIALVAVAQSENSRLRTVVRELKDGTGGWTEKMRAAVPVIQDSAGATERTYEAGRRWRDVLSEMKAGVIAYIGPAGDMLAGVGGLTTGLIAAGPHLGAMARATGLVTVAQKALNLVLRLNPIGLVITAVALVGAALWKWRDQIVGFLQGGWNLFMSAIETGISWLNKIPGVNLGAELDDWKFSMDDAAESTEALADDISTELTPAAVALVPAAREAKEEIKAFDLATADLKTQLQQVKPEIKDVGDLLEASGVQAGAAVLPWGFFADETSVKVPDAMGIVMDSIMKVPPTAEEVARQLRVIAPTWGQELIGGLKSTFSPLNVGATLSRAFESGAGVMDAVKSLGAQAGGHLMDKVGTALSAMGPWGQVAAAALPLAAAFGKKIWGGIVGMFGGPSEEVQAARGDLDAFAGDVEARVGQTESSTERLQDFLASGWERNRALVVTFFQDQALASGRSAQAGVDHFTAYQAAMEDGNAELMAQLEQQALDWNVTNATAATEAEEAWAASYTAQTVTSVAMTDEAIANSGRLKEAVVADTVEILAGWTAMVEGMELAWGGHEDAENGLGGMQLSATAFREAMVGEGVGGTFGKITDWAIGGFEAMGESWAEHMHGMVESAEAMAASATAAIRSIPGTGGGSLGFGNRHPVAGGGVDYNRLTEAMTHMRVEVGAGDISRVALDNMARVARRRGYRGGR